MGVYVADTGCLENFKAFVFFYFDLFARVGRGEGLPFICILGPSSKWRILVTRIPDLATFHPFQGHPPFGLIFGPG